MELSFWNNTFPKIKKIPTDRLLYGVHPYRIEILMKGSKCLRGSKKGRSNAAFEEQFGIMCTQLFFRRNRFFGGAENYETWKSKNMDKGLLKRIYKILQKYDNDVKIRSHGTKLFISSNALSILEEIAVLFKNKRQFLISVSYPASDEALAIINTGAILTKRKPKFKFQISLSNRNGGGGYAERKKSSTAVAEHLKNLDGVFVPHSTMERLKKGLRLSGATIFTNDPTLLGFISLINPYILGKISTLSHATDK